MLDIFFSVVRSVDFTDLILVFLDSITEARALATCPAKFSVFDDAVWKKRMNITAMQHNTLLPSGDFKVSKDHVALCYLPVARMKK